MAEDASTVNLRGEGGVVWTYDLPLPGPIAEQVDSGKLTPDDAESAKALGVEDEPEPAAEVSRDATAKAAELAAEVGVDLAEIEGTGKDGRVTVEDVEAATAS